MSSRARASSGAPSDAIVRTRNGADASSVATGMLRPGNGGAITLVEQDGHQTVAAAGDAKIGRRKARPQDRFWVGSITKSFVAAVVKQLVGEHKVRLDERLSALLPGRLREGRRIRVRNLLN